ncbi:MAG TPA: FxsA family protein [Stellaceae bacterium]|jgi:UPF0716 protein FxsA|nr:FxsA family protein [Stellaceae bacterium]
MGRLITVFLWPLAEIIAFVEVGHVIGLAGVLLAIVLGVAAGMSVLRRSGLRALAALQRGAAGNDPQALDEAAEDGWMALAGALLIIPGFVSDVVALLLLMPAVRRWLVRNGRKPMIMGSMRMGSGRMAGGGFTFRSGFGSNFGKPPESHDAPVIDGEFHEVGTREIENGPPQDNHR